MGAELRKSCQDVSTLSMPLSRVLGLTSGSLIIDFKAFPTIPAAPAQSLTSTPLHGNEHSWAVGSFQKPFEIWAGAQNPRVEIFLPPLSTAHGLQHRIPAGDENTGCK